MLSKTVFRLNTNFFVCHTPTLSDYCGLSNLCGKQKFDFFFVAKLDSLIFYARYGRSCLTSR